MSDVVAPETMGVAEIARVMELLPHRYPMLLVDKVVDMIPSKSAVGIKNVTINEPYFVGHFPAQPVMPGVLIIEAMAQTAAALVVHSLGTNIGDKIVYFMTVDKGRFRQPVSPGDTLHMPVTVLRGHGSVWKFSGQAKVGDTLVAEAEYSAMIVDPQGQRK